MKKTTKIILIVLAVVVAAVAILIFVFLRALNASLSDPVADYDTRIEIWNTVAGNSSKSKLDDMNIDYGGKLLISTMHNVPMLFSSFDANAVRDEVTREKLLQQTDLAANFNSSEIPQFIAYGTKDKMVNMEGTKAYISVTEAAGTDVKVVVAEGQNHGFKQKYYMSDFLEFWTALCRG